MKEINLIGNSFYNLRKGTRYNRAPARGESFHIPLNIIFLKHTIAVRS